MTQNNYLGAQQFLGKKCSLTSMLGDIVVQLNSATPASTGCTGGSAYVNTALNCTNPNGAAESSPLTLALASLAAFSVLSL